MKIPGQSAHTTTVLNKPRSLIPLLIRGFSPSLDWREIFTYPRGTHSRMLCHFLFGFTFRSFGYLCRPQHVNIGLESQDFYCLRGDLGPQRPNLIQRILGLKGPPSWPPSISWRKKNSRRIGRVKDHPKFASCKLDRNTLKGRRFLCTSHILSLFFCNCHFFMLYPNFFDGSSRGVYYFPSTVLNMFNVASHLNLTITPESTIIFFN